LTAIYHGFNGVWTIIEDYIHIKLLRLALFGILTTIALCLIFIGLLTIFKTTYI
jgi:succinate dehydrogenase hydrophobic anchor subunit